MLRQLLFVLLVAPLLLGAGKDYDRAFARDDLQPPVLYIENAPKKVDVGDEFTVDLVLDLGDYASSGHEVSVVFTAGILVVVAVDELGAPPHEMNLSPGVGMVLNEFGLVARFEAASLGTAVDPVGPFTIGRITFVAAGKGKAMIAPILGIGGAVMDGADRAVPIEGVVLERARINVRR